MSNRFAEGTPLIIEVTKILDAGGNQTLLDGIPSWSSSDPKTLSMTPSRDGLFATGIMEKLGPVTITATCGGMSGSVALTGIARKAVSFNLEASIAEEDSEKNME